MAKKYVSVFIPTFNGADYISECLDAVLAQRLPQDYELEVIAIDSGSSDGTLEILKSYGARISLSTIPNSEFSHGGTRAKGAHMAKGEFILFLTQDATPANANWLASMIEPFFISEKIGCVFGRQFPRPNAAATIKREVSGVFGAIGAHDSIVIYRHRSLVNGQKVNELNSFFSDVNSAVRRDLLEGSVPLRHVNYAEDQRLAEDMQNKGYLKAYAPQGVVIHSNEYTPREYFYRKFDEYIGLHDTVNFPLVASNRSLLLGWVRPTIADWKFIKRDREYSIRSKLVWALEAPFYNMGPKAGQYFAAKSLKNKTIKDRFSLEKKIRKN